MSVGCIVLAAGRSTRMGTNKLVEDLGGKPVIGHVVDAIHDAGFPPPVVVLGHDPDAIRTALHGRDVRFTMAYDHADGMARSLAAGIATAPADWIAAIICLGDMPMLRADLLIKLAEDATEASIIVPMFEGGRGNPVLWGRSFFPRLTSLVGDVGAKPLLAEYADRVTALSWSDDDGQIDVDEPAALALVRRRMAERRT